MIASATEKGRWYDYRGRLVECGAAEAREKLHFPSVSTITGAFRNFGLEKYRDEQMILAGSTEPRLPDDNDESFTKRVLAAADEHRNEAAERGTRQHAGYQRFIETGRRDPAAPTQVQDWIETHLATGVGPPAKKTAIVNIERAMVNTELGYAGTTDYWGPYYDKDGNGKVAIVDFKTQGVKVYTYTEKRKLKSGIVKEYQRTRKSVNWIPKWWWQLAAYKAAAERYARRLQIPPPVVCVSVAINTNTEHPGYESAEFPGMWAREWPAAQIDRGVAIVKALTVAWYLANNFPLPGSEQRAEQLEKLGRTE